jgi:hypothetical protein
VTDAAQARWSKDWSDPPEPEALLREAEPHLSRFRSKHWTWSR